MKYRFGPYLLDAETGALVGPDGPITLRRQTFRLLEVLLDHAPALVDRDTLLDEAWGRTALSPNVLPQAISELRQALGDSASDPSVIETLHRRGYRILPDVEPIETHGAGASPDRARPPWTALLSVVAVSVLALAWWWQGADRRWLERELLPAVEAQIETDITAAWRLVREARERVPDDPRIEQLWLDLSLPVSLDSEPTGARIEVAGYGAGPADWVPIGTTPLADERLPLSALRFRVSKAGFESIEVAPSVLPFAEPFRLHPADEAPDGMVYVPPGPARYHRERAELPGFWIDRHEVTNADYLEFVEAGGYQDPALWPERVEIDGEMLDRAALLRRFVDGTGMPGPSSWAFGTYPDGEGGHPVSGVSWFEASAYAEWVGKQLPTAFHWYRAAGLGGDQAALFSEILPASNFGRDGTTPVGEARGLGPFGTYDMAGNVREWSRTRAGNRPYAMGAAFHENSYQFTDWQVFEPTTRDRGAGFRLMLQADETPDVLPGTVTIEARSPADPVDDETFAIYRRLYDYDKTPLNVDLVAVGNDHADWRRERIEFDAAYGDERVILQLFLPEDVEPPYQTVVHFPGGDARLLDDSNDAGLLHVEPFLRTGRAVAYPVFKGTFERGPVPPSGPIGVRDLLIQQAKDLRRTLDYLETRDDIDTDRLAFHGVSYGATRAPYLLATEPRFAIAMLVSTGLSPTEHLPPEIQQVDYLARVTLPLLLVTGRNDLTMSYEESQRPFFERLATPGPDKQHVALDSGHLPPGYTELSRHLLEWIDRWFGPAGDGRFAQAVDIHSSP
ncbi:SUMF1/EgtB/PvdO family nonheme iron enzyme [Wenzhouxiangella sp. XN79A]|uniref:SUMF1/EgtB/PvdO family nonheme iron enzyme n=1 Tax=Wenzhouxiangella sp. XN79A TaxID=2724193 RepID=UPI00144A7D7F|nr:SUMF1/EgtB/PvdO family nonheme iron enzyme [Wenzhouxiangella sp. XN79A]NKI36135.1 SUMF1/EgtB/PvdO family nonheme iron enzyme [Wenzhouxiangella sp. XN79A]